MKQKNWKSMKSILNTEIDNDQEEELELASPAIYDITFKNFKDDKSEIS